MKQLDNAMNALRQQAQKSAQEELKKVASKIAAANAAQREATKKYEALKESTVKLVSAYELEAQELVAAFEEQWGTWDQQSAKVVDLNKDN